MIGKFVSGLSDTGKKILVVALIFVVVALFDRLLIGPTMSRMEMIDQDIAREESSIKQDLHFLGYKDKILKESKVFEPFITTEIPAEEEIIAGFLKQLEVLAGKANVTLIKVTPSTGVQEKDYWKYTADLECSGKLSDVASFMDTVNKSNDLMKVSKFNFTPKKDSDDLKAVMTVEKVVVGKRSTPPAAQTKAPAAASAASAQASDAPAPASSGK